METHNLMNFKIKVFIVIIFALISCRQPITDEKERVSIRYEDTIINLNENLEFIIENNTHDTLNYFIQAAVEFSNGRGIVCPDIIQPLTSMVICQKLMPNSDTNLIIKSSNLLIPENGPKINTLQIDSVKFGLGGFLSRDTCNIKIKTIGTQFYKVK